jgi:flagellar biosynthesis anti-sigma factor FlgM
LRIAGQDTVNTISNSQTQSVFELSNNAGGTSQTPSNPTVSSDGVDLGNQSGLLSQAQNAGSSDRAARVEQLRALVQSGQYQVDAAALSRSLVSAALSGY